MAIKGPQKEKKEDLDQELTLKSHGPQPPPPNKHFKGSCELLSKPCDVIPVTLSNG